MALVLYDTRVYEKFMEKVWSTVVRIIGIAEGKDDEVVKPRTNTSKIGRKRVLRHPPGDHDSDKRPLSSTSMQWAWKTAFLGQDLNKLYTNQASICMIK